jgi:hypothetical protein
MHTHGVPLWPDPESSGSSDEAPLTLRRVGISSSQLAAAEQACRSLLPTFSATQQSPHVLAQALGFSECMRAHGATTFPDPESNGAISIPRAIKNSPAYLAALRFCLHKYGAPPPPSPAGKDEHQPSRCLTEDSGTQTPSRLGWRWISFCSDRS